VTGVAVFIHPGRDPRGPLADLRAFERAGGDPTRTVVSHVDRRIRDTAFLEDLAATGCYLEFDCFGLEPWLDDATLVCPQPCDLERIELIEWLMSAGHTERIVMSQDIAMKHRLTAYGGHGYDHVVRNIAPLFRGRGVSEAEIATMLVDNPRRVLSREV
jgi:phosphotriesterase-related protein